MTRTAIISVDGHVKASLKGYRGYVDPGLRERYDEYVSAMEEAGTTDPSNVRPEYGLESQWDTAARQAALEAKGVVAEVLFPNGIPFQLNPFDDHARVADPELEHAGR